MLRYRLISGLLLTLGALLLFWADSSLETVQWQPFWRESSSGQSALPPGLVLLIVVLALAPVAAVELSRIFQADGIAAQPWLMGVGAMALALAMYLSPLAADALAGATIIATTLGACLIATLVWHCRHAQVKGAAVVAGATMLGVTYLGLLSGFYLAIRHSHSAWVVLAVILITKAGDIGAYFTGRAVGRHKLIPWLSPGKTWEGLAGGVVLAMLGASGLAWLAGRLPHLTAVHHFEDGQLVIATHSYDLVWAAAGGALLALVGHLGDLTMSLFKRDAGVKDSGSLIPGMGGLLDVADSPLLVGPVAYWVLQAATRS